MPFFAPPHFSAKNGPSECMMISFGFHLSSKLLCVALLQNMRTYVSTQISMPFGPLQRAEVGRGVGLDLCAMDLRNGAEVHVPGPHDHALLAVAHLVCLRHRIAGPKRVQYISQIPEAWWA